jgi:hypothetical protein
MIQVATHCECNENTKICITGTSDKCLVHSHFTVFTSSENAAHVGLLTVPHYVIAENSTLCYEFGSTPCIPYLLSINDVCVVGYMHAFIFIIFLPRWFMSCCCVICTLMYALSRPAVT